MLKIENLNLLCLPINCKLKKSQDITDIQKYRNIKLE